MEHFTQLKELSIPIGIIMSFIKTGFKAFCNWVSWRRIIEFSFVFLFVRFIASMISDHTIWSVSDTLQDIIIYLFGLCCGIGLVFSADRRKRESKTKLQTLVKSIKDR